MASSSSELRRWRAGIWPSTPPLLPGLQFPGPVGLWDGGALLSYDQAESQGFLHDERFRLPPPGTYAGQHEANERRYERFKRELRLNRGELYLEVARVDLDDVDGILDFVSTFDVLDVRALDAPRMARQWFGTAVEPRSTFRILRHYAGFGDQSRHAAADDSLREEVIAIADRQRQAAPNWVVAETIEEFRWGARLIHDLHAAWECLRDGADPRAVDWANPRMAGWGKAAGVQWDVMKFFERTMRDALEGFSPRMWLVDVDTERVGLAAVTTPAPDDVTLLEILVLELFRHIAEDASYKRCANPSCGRTFVRQDGGAVHGQSRMTGVLYCTRTCANAVAQRRLRQRRAKQDG